MALVKAKRIDEKHSIAVDNTTWEPVLCKRLATGELQPIPPEEPVILFRGRDKLALPMLLFYIKLCVEADCTPYQFQSMATMIGAFIAFSHIGKDKMNVPGSTMGH